MLLKKLQAKRKGEKMLILKGEFLEAGQDERKNKEGKVTYSDYVKLLSDSEVIKVKVENSLDYSASKKLDKIEMPVTVRSWSFGDRNGLTFTHKVI